MKIGLCIPNYGSASSKEAIDQSARIAENMKYDHIWTTDHLIVPKQYSSPYGKCYESLATLSYLAGKTENVALGTSIIIFPLREVVLFAKQAATVQILSDDRLMLGLGAGWNEVEFQNVRADFEGRGRYYDEGVQLFRSLLEGRKTEFKGDYYSIGDGVFEPLPRKPIPIFFGGSSGPSLRRTARFGDGWHPVGISPEEVRSGAEKLARLTDRKMKIVVRLSVNYNEKPIDERERRQRTVLSGSSSEIVARIKDYEKAGCTDLVCYFGNIDLEKINEDATIFAREVIPSL